MPIPDYETVMLPLLKLCKDGEEHNLSEVNESLAKEFQLSGEELAQRIPSGRQRVFYSRVHWARTYLKGAGLLVSTGYGKFRITPRGIQVLKSNPPEIDDQFLRKYSEFQEFQAGSKKTTGKDAKQSTKSHTPLEQIITLSQEYDSILADALLEKLKSLDDTQFEGLSVDLLEKMGYGQGSKTGKSHDKGIDGIIFEDRLGLDKVLVQAKRWGDDVVGRPIVQQFVGSMEQHKGLKGVIMTTSHFAKSAQDYVLQVGKTVVLIDGVKLAALMIENGVGVTEVNAISIKEIDTDYFQEL